MSNNIASTSNPNVSLRLQYPLRLTEQTWQEGTVPVVSVCCITYNHEKFIREALEGFLMQETTFPVEVWIHDDASTDATAAIIREYERRYPKIIRPIYQTENQWSLGKKASLLVMEGVRGEFVALCEGDDYWTDPNKLELQHNMMEKDPGTAGCFHLMEMKFEDGSPSQVYPPKDKHHDRIFEDIAFSYHLSMGSIFYRKCLYEQQPPWAEGLYMGDVPLIAELCLKGRFRFINKIMGVYRQHDGGVWSALDWRKKPKISYDLMDAILKHFRDKDLPRVRECKKKYTLELFKLAAEVGNKAEMRKYLWEHLVSQPNRWQLPPHQKRAIVKCLLPW